MECCLKKIINVQLIYKSTKVGSVELKKIKQTQTNSHAYIKSLPFHDKTFHILVFKAEIHLIFI